MIHLCDELPFERSNGTSFESYMFASEESYTKRHTDCSDWKITILNKGESYDFNDCESVESRSKAQKFFNKVLYDGGYDIWKKAEQLRMQLVYLGINDDKPGVIEDCWKEESELLLHICKKYSEQSKSIIAISPHFHQLDQKKKNIQYPHIHMIYTPKPDTPSLVDVIEYNLRMS